MKKLLSLIFVFFCVFCGYGQTKSADNILSLVRAKLPNDPLVLTGSLKVKARNGFTKANLPVTMELDWGAATPTAKYRIDKESLTITWNSDVPAYEFSNPKNSPTSDILGTGLTWADLSFSVLWWPDSKLTGEESKINRDCYVVDVPVPDSDKTMRLWIEKKMGMLLEAQTLDKKGKQLRRLKIKSIKKMDGMWVAKDLELTDKKTGSKTTLQISDLQWKDTAAPGGPNGPALETFNPAESVNQLAFDLYAKLSEKTEGNLFFSPYSISSALAMTYAGARGETEAEMTDALHFGGQVVTHPDFYHLRKTLGDIQDKGHVQLSVANSLWPEKSYPFLEDYLALTKEFYDAEIEPVDYQTNAEGARKKINQWVENQTNERIKDLIPTGALDPLTRLVLANAIYFKGSWALPFEEEATSERPFTLLSGEEIKVPTMAQTDDFMLARSDTFQALQLPYEGGDLSMVILLPNEPENFPTLENETISSLEFKKTEVMVHLPKFKIESPFGLTGTLSDMGMPLAFSDKANFSGMDGRQELYIDAVFHKAFVEVNEEGTEATAATAIVIRTKSIPASFIANHPFLFLIQENSTGTMLFIGRVMDPSK